MPFSGIGPGWRSSILRFRSWDSNIDNIPPYTPSPPSRTTVSSLLQGLSLGSSVNHALTSTEDGRHTGQTDSWTSGRTTSARLWSHGSPLPLPSRVLVWPTNEMSKHPCPGWILFLSLQLQCDPSEFRQPDGGMYHGLTMIYLQHHRCIFLFSPLL